VINNKELPEIYGILQEDKAGKWVLNKNLLILTIKLLLY